MIVFELAKYLNMSCKTIDEVLTKANTDIDKLVKICSKFPEILYEHVIPSVFNYFYKVTSETKNYEVEHQLLIPKKDNQTFAFNPIKNLVIHMDDAEYAKFKEKSFHTDYYCFDSEAEKNYFNQSIKNEKTKELYFTGMFTGSSNGLSVQYIDPITHQVRNYFPDFYAILEDGTHELIEVKGDHMIDDIVVQAKKEAAEELASESKMIYRIIKSSDLS
jgi:hypothetical protein